MSHRSPSRLLALLSVSLLTICLLSCGGAEEPSDDGGRGISQGGSGGEGGSPGAGGSGGIGGAGGSGGGDGTGGSGGERPCTREAYTDPACVECVEEAIDACQVAAQTLCSSELTDLVICAVQKGCGSPPNFDYECLFRDCVNPSEAMIACVVENCEAMAACVDLR